MRLFFIFIFLVACGSHKTAPKTDPSPDISTLYSSASARLISMLDSGWVVSRYDDKSMEHQGDALIWSGIAMASLSCEQGEIIESALIDAIVNANGSLYRHPSLPNQISMDGAIGLYRGIAHRIKACGKADAWKHAMELHIAIPDDILNSDSNVGLPPEFTYVRDLVAARTTGGPDPSLARMDALTAEVTGWALGVVQSKSPCFRINLGFQSLKAAEELGINVDHGPFCLATKDVHLAQVDTWCDRPGAETWIRNFKYDEWEYAHQRCVAWESPDGKPNLHTPGLDLIELLKENYNL